MVRLIDTITAGLGQYLVEQRALGATMDERRDETTPYFDQPGTSNGALRGHKRTRGTPPRHRSRLPQPNPPHRQMPTRRRQLQIRDPRSSMKSQSLFRLPDLAQRHEC